MIKIMYDRDFVSMHETGNNYYRGSISCKHSNFWIKHIEVKYFYVHQYMCHPNYKNHVQY